MKTYSRKYQTEAGEIELVNYYKDNNSLDSIHAILERGETIILTKDLGLYNTDTTKIKKIISYLKLKGA